VRRFSRISSPSECMSDCTCTSQPEGNFLLSLTEIFIFILRKIPFSFPSNLLFTQKEEFVTHTHIFDSPNATHTKTVGVVFRAKRSEQATHNAESIDIFALLCFSTVVTAAACLYDTYFPSRHNFQGETTTTSTTAAGVKGRGCFSTSHLTHIHQKSDSRELRKCCSKTN
jgi:hypothetical protein